MSGRLEIGRITICRFSSPRSPFRFFFTQNATGKHRLGGFPTWSMYFWYIRSNQRRFKPNWTCWAVGWKSIASQYVDFRAPDPHFGYFSPKVVRKKHRLGVFPIWSMYLWSIRSIERRFQPDFTCWAVGWKSVASRYVDFRPPDLYFGFFSPIMLLENIVSMISYLNYVFVMY